MTEGIVLFSLPLNELIESLRSVVREEITNSQNKELEDKLYSPKEACKLFVPAISRQTLDSISKEGTLTKHHFGGKVFYRYSDIIKATKTFKRYKKKGEQDFS